MKKALFMLGCLLSATCLQADPQAPEHNQGKCQCGCGCKADCQCGCHLGHPCRCHHPR
ncbi:MAG: hypothetical protein LW832_04615 [Parachlamydia sp.]|nr:hypothetical protein [Parachlamydia sp.]